MSPSPPRVILSLSKDLKPLRTGSTKGLVVQLRIKSVKNLVVQLRTGSVKGLATSRKQKILR